MRLQGNQFTLKGLFLVLTVCSCVFALAAFDLWLCVLVLGTVAYSYVAVRVSVSLDRFHASSVSFGVFGGLSAFCSLNMLLSLGGGIQGVHRTVFQWFLAIGIALGLAMLSIALVMLRKDLKYWFS